MDETTRESTTRYICLIFSAELISQDPYRPELMFYKLDVLDPLGKSPWKRSDDPHLNGTFGGDLNMFAKVIQEWDPSIELNHDELIEDDDGAEVKALKAQFANAKEDSKALDFEFEWPNLLPDG